MRIKNFINNNKNIDEVFNNSNLDPLKFFKNNEQKLIR